MEIYMSYQKHNDKKKKKNQKFEQWLRVSSVQKIALKKYEISFEVDIDKHTLY